jgi:outer membrane receptor protein involved in Fe transport
MRRLRHSLLLMVIAGCLVTRPLFAGPTATLTGRVTDTTGSVIAGVRVEATNVETNVVLMGETNAEGRYNIPDLPPGTYRVTVRKFAFQTVNKPGVELHVQDVVALNFSMELGSVSQSVTVQPGTPLIQAGPQRGGAFVTREVSELPLLSLSPISLARTLPGVIEPRGTHTYLTVANDESTLFIVNGARNRGNNYLLDTTENNDLVYTGVAQPFNITDAVEEVSVQTGNYGVEFGRSSGAVFNVVTKSGTNALTGTILGRYQSELFNSVSNMDRRNGAPRIPYDRQVYGFTAGGPVHKNKTFFFGAFQHDNFRSRHYTLVLPTESAVATLRALFPLNPRLDTYLKYLGNLRGTADPFSVQLGRDPITRNDRGTVQFARAALDQRETNEGPQWMLRLDHNRSDRHRFAFRYLYDSRIDSPAGPNFGVTFPGFYVEHAAQTQNALFTDQYTFSPTRTNEFRFSFARQSSDQGRVTPDSVPEAMKLPHYSIGGQTINAPGIGGIDLQFRRIRNFLFQDTLTTLRGRHTFRYGVEFLRQLATQSAAARFNGEIAYNDALGVGYSAFANFLDDFSGVGGGRSQKDFPPEPFHPNSLRQTYFLQDVWLPAPSLSLTLGLRYENFGQPANALRYPAFSDFDPIFKPNRVNTDNNNFGPAFGLGWSPTFRSSMLRRLFGENKAVWRGGYQISYEGFFTQPLSLLLATATPNGMSWTLSQGATGRGTPNWSAQLPENEPPKSILDTQRGAFDKNLRNAYTERWSFGFQRQLSNSLLIDGSYVGSESHKLLTWIEVNPVQPGGARLHPDFGSRQIRAGDGNSAYHAMQWRVDRRFARGFQVMAAYTWSRTIDNTSEGAGTVSSADQSPQILQVGVKRERGLSDFHRTHRLSISYVWTLPTVRNRLWNVALGGWSLAGITSFQSGAPFTVTGSRSNSVTLAETLNRPDIGNPNAPLNTRAIVSEICSETGYYNPDTNLCVSPAGVHWIQGSGPINAATVGRNTLQAGSVFNSDLSLSKSFQIAEQKKLEFRVEAMNAFNHPQFIHAPARDVVNLVNSPPGRFLNPDFTDSGVRSMWVQLKLRF